MDRPVGFRLVILSPARRDGGGPNALARGEQQLIGRFLAKYLVEGFKTGTDAALDFAVEVPRAGRYDLSVLASTS
jgi:hypothetical protein